MKGLMKGSGTSASLQSYAKNLSEISSVNYTNTHVFYKQHFYKQRQAEIAKNQANAKQHHEAEVTWLMKLSD